jgi:ABC-type nitrate/sulfonate/bicarbonate transport system substrate-binding protein
MTNLILALDWTPNINHIGFFVAQTKGFYKDQELNLRIIDPSEDNYAITPAKKLELGAADFALCPTESILSYRTKEIPFPMISIAAILQKDLSAIAVMAESNIESPKSLDGKSYASYKARYEDQIVKQMIKNDGGNGNIHVVYPDKLGIWDTLTKQKFDSTWIFTNWEGVEAEQNGIDLRLFKMEDYTIPYSYSPMLVANETMLDSKKEAYTNFLAATKKGFLYTIEKPVEAAEILKRFLSEKDKDINVVKAIERSAHSFGELKTWGKMDEKVITAFLDWIYEHKLEDQQISVSEMMTNALNS